MGSQPTPNPLIENLLCWIDKAGEAILALKPVTFRYKEELDPAGVPQFGLVAEQVEKVDPSRYRHKREHRTL
jgi:Chaperone of endosialidase